MLSRYKKSYRKIAMGLLALVVKDKELRSLQQLIDLYESDPLYQLYIWKENEKIVGLIGVAKEANEFNVQHLSIIPSYAKDEIAEKMLASLQEISRFEKMRIANEADEESLPVSKGIASMEQAIS
ncbi:hypothetical protein BN1080_02193 [Planococcus massiliensis]|uniref:Riboflavin biosynthesis RibT protein n=1 Tax=Planococcus massiliensis TaxID=1499687 RepID=A0A098ELS5_9BACL|nr:MULTISPECIES: hypothetical protein [Planococcus]MCJ1908585.1 hypothetical protein [Planococcus ruber]CEG23243.1 hypothetical protein BN1080_02193 [Planococcus massiliensis]